MDFLIDEIEVVFFVVWEVMGKYVCLFVFKVIRGWNIDSLLDFFVNDYSWV